MKLKGLITVLLFSITSTALAAPNYKACNMCHMQAQSNPMLNCSSACKDIRLLGGVIPQAKAVKNATKRPKDAPLATEAGCRACHLCRMNSGSGYNSTNCIDQCSSCHLADPFARFTNRLSNAKHHNFQNSPGFAHFGTQVPSPAKSTAPEPVAPQPAVSNPPIVPKAAPAPQQQAPAVQPAAAS